MKELTKQDLHDILLGAATISTGGGGSLEAGIELIDQAVADNCNFRLADDTDLDNSALVGSPYFCGSISPFTKEQQAAYDKLPKVEETSAIYAIRAIEGHLNKKVEGVIATELGGNNTAIALEAAGRMNLPIIDADPAGRSVPCLEQTTFYLKDIPIAPMGLANSLGDEIVISKVANDNRAEALSRALAVASFNTVGVIDHVNTWEVIRSSIHLNTISWCLEIGRVVRAEQENGRNYVAAVIKQFDGYEMFEGTVIKAFYEDLDGFTVGETHIEGINAYAGKILKVWYQNENLISTLDDKPYVLTPDLINICNCDTNMPLLNPYAKAGMQVKVFANKARSEWRSKKGLSILGPKFFNFDYDYIPVETIIK